MKNKIWLISDTHFNHGKMIEYCSRPEDFNELIWKGLKQIADDDILIHLGDIGIGRDEEVHNRLNEFKFKKILVLGNHDRKCLSKNTRLLTKDGYKYYTELKEGECIPTVNLKTNKVEFKPINDIYIYKNTPEIYVAKSRSAIMEITNHHIVINQLGSNKTNNKWKKQIAENLWNSKTPFKVPVAFGSVSKYDISDDYLKLIAWIMTDGSILSSGKIIIYQSKENYIEEIKNLLDRLNIKFNEKIKESKVKYICGKKIKSTLPAHIFNLDINQSRIFLEKTKLKNKYHIPEYLWHISDKQFEIFITEMIKGDGTFMKRGTLVLWGKYDFILKIMGLCVTHNRSANICKQSGTDNYYLCIRKKNTGKQFNKSHLSIQKYNDITWCVNVENNVIFTELNNKTFVTGNSNNWYLNHGWDFVCYTFTDKYFGQKILFSHIPQEENGYDINIHGHCHNAKRRLEHEPTMNDKQVLIALENTNYQPVLLKNVIENYVNNKNKKRKR